MKFERYIDPDFEARYWVNLLRTVQEGFFQKIRASITESVNLHTWCIPALPILDRRSTHDMIRALPHNNIAHISPSPLTPLISSQLDTWRKSHHLAVDQIIDKREFDALQKISKKFITQITQLFDLRALRIDHVYIIPTTIGTHGTFGYKESHGRYDLFLTYRRDIGIQTIPATLCNCLIHLLTDHVDDEEKGYDDWRVRQQAADFISTHTFVRHYADILRGARPYYSPTLTQLAYDQTPLTIESLTHYARLGYPLTSQVNVRDDMIYIGETAITSIQALPKKIAIYLITHRGRLVTFDELADVYWGASSEQSSQYTMAKAIQKIRGAFKSHGVHQEIIKTVRKQGYILL